MTVAPRIEGGLATHDSVEAGTNLTDDRYLGTHFSWKKAVATPTPLSQSRAIFSSFLEAAFERNPRLDFMFS